MVAIDKPSILSNGIYFLAHHGPEEVNAIIAKSEAIILVYSIMSPSSFKVLVACMTSCIGLFSSYYIANNPFVR